MVCLWFVIVTLAVPLDMTKLLASPWTAEEGSPLPSGVTWIPELQAYNFALYSEHAEKVTLLLYEESDLVRPLLSYQFDYLKNKTERTWHCIIPGSKMKNARYYAYSVDGPLDAGSFLLHSFDPQKILLDPYAKTIFFPADFERAAAIGAGSNAGRAPLGLIPQAQDNTPPASGPKPLTG